MILKIIIATLVIYLVYIALQKWRAREGYESKEIDNKTLLKTCKSKCDDTYKMCVQNHCSGVIESNERRLRRERLDKLEQKKNDGDKRCIAKCSENNTNDEDRKTCTLKCYKGNTVLNDKMRNCYKRCAETHKVALDRDACISKCHTKEINLDREKASILKGILKEGFDAPYNGANLNVAENPVSTPKDKHTFNFKEFKDYVRARELYLPTEGILRQLYDRLNMGTDRLSKDVYVTYRIYLNDISVNYDTFDEFASINSLRVLTPKDRKDLFKRLDSSRTGYITYARLIKGLDEMPMTYSYGSFVNILREYIGDRDIGGKLNESHYRRLFKHAKGDRGSDVPTELIETMDNPNFNVVDSTRILNDNVTRANPMRGSDLTLDGDATGTRDYILRDELDVLLNPIIRDLKKGRDNRIFDRILKDTDRNIERDMKSCKRLGRERIQLAPVLNSDDIHNIVNKVHAKIRKCAPPPLVKKSKDEGIDELQKKAHEFEKTERLINSIGKDLINSGLFKSYVENKCGFFCPANGKYIPDDDPLILPREMRKGTVYDIWNPKSIKMKVTPSTTSISGRDLSYRNTDYWNRVPRKVLDPVCSDKNCLVKPYND